MATNIPIQTPNIPRVCLCGQARSGTSMMMRVLQAGGLTIDTDGREADSTTIQIFRQPYGFFENIYGINNEIFVNSFKLLKVAKISQVPADYKFVFIKRDLAKIKASWAAMGQVYQTLGGHFPTSDRQIEAEDKYNKWQVILAANPDLFLILDYDQICADPASMATNLANYLNTAAFTFNQANAINAVDTNLYINRN